MRIHDSLIDLIGDTPLVRLRRVTAGLAATVAAKVEYLNPGGSVKDRIALRMVQAAEESGQLRPGGTLVEPTSGNTGVGLALVAQSKGYRCVFTCPDKVSADKIAVLRAYGAEVVICPAAVPPEHPASYRSVAARLAGEIPGAVRLDQYAHPDNARSHYLGTGPEIWRQTDGRITHFVASVGTGGTISGVGAYLREVSGGTVRVVGADPDGSIYSGGGGRPYLLEGVGQPSRPPSFDPSVPDEILAVTDLDSIEMTRRLAREEGLLAGGSAGLAVAAALRVAEGLGPDALVVVMLPDSGRGYLSKIFNDDWLARLGLAWPATAGPRVADLLAGQGFPVPVVKPDATLADAVKTMSELGVRHLLVADATPPLRLAEVRGLLTEHAVATAMLRGPGGVDDRAGEHLDAPVPHVGVGEPLTAALAVLGAAGAVVALEGGLVRGVLTTTDIVSHLANGDPGNHAAAHHDGMKEQ